MFNKPILLKKLGLPSQENKYCVHFKIPGANYLIKILILNPVDGSVSAPMENQLLQQSAFGLKMETKFFRKLQVSDVFCCKLMYCI